MQRNRYEEEIMEGGRRRSHEIIAETSPEFSHGLTMGFPCAVQTGIYPLYPTLSIFQVYHCIPLRIFCYQLIPLLKPEIFIITPDTPAYFLLSLHAPA